MYSQFRYESEVWELYFQFDGAKFVHKRIHRSEIRYLKLLSVLEEEGYGMCDSLYYVKNEGEGLNGLELIDSNLKVEEMVRKYESSKKVVLTVMKDRRNRAIILSPVKRRESFNIDLVSDDEAPMQYQYPSLVDHDQQQFQTQESVCFEGGNMANSVTEEEEGSEIEEEEEHDRKRRKKDPLLHMEGETDVEDIYDIPADEPVNVPALAVKKPVKRPGPTTRSHSQVQVDDVPLWIPSDDEGDLGFLKQEDDDGFEPLPFVLPSGRKSRAKKAVQRVWYDEARQNAEQQFAVKLCFKDVYQFRQALASIDGIWLTIYFPDPNLNNRFG
jgi:hypothetical protein